jgi:drug/metabolite transporter (DMT)-like permease
VSGLEMSFYRFVIAAICLFIYCRVKGHTLRIGMKRMLLISAIGTFGMVGYHLLFFKSIVLIDVLESSSINALNPVLSAFLGYLYIY